MPGQYTIVARFVAKPECATELLGVLLETAKIAAEEEPGCRRFEILQGVDAAGNALSDVFMTNELFDDFAAVEAHRNSWRTPIKICADTRADCQFGARRDGNRSRRRRDR